VLLRATASGIELLACSVIVLVALVAIAAWLAPSPPLQAYPLSVALRFFFTAAGVYAVSSLLWLVSLDARLGSSPKKRAAALVAIALAFISVILFITQSDSGLAQWVRDLLLGAYSPVRLVVGNWNLIDV
jgi:ABC-type Na+ efflux pump permease subunit